jgi:copper resistance protein D
MSLYFVNVSIHLLAALLWLGGMFFFAAVGAPVLRRVEPPALRAELFTTLGNQFRLIGWMAIGILLLTGVGNLHFRGLLRWDLWSNPAFWGSGYGTALAWKLGAVTTMVVASAMHDFVWGPAATRLKPGTPEAKAMRIRASWLARLNAVVGIVVVLAAVRLSRGV